MINKTIYLALGLNMGGRREAASWHVDCKTEGAKFWLQVLAELRTRGVGDILIACVDSVTGFPDAIQSVYPKSKSQLCIANVMRNSVNVVAWTDGKKIAVDFERIYRSTTADDSEVELDAFCEKWDGKVPSIGMI